MGRGLRMHPAVYLAANILIRAGLIAASFLLFRMLGRMALFYVWFAAWNNSWLALPLFLAAIFGAVFWVGSTIWLYMLLGKAIDARDERLWRARDAET